VDPADPGTLDSPLPDSPDVPAIPDFAEESAGDVPDLFDPGPPDEGPPDLAVPDHAEPAGDEGTEDLPPIPDSPELPEVSLDVDPGLEPDPGMPDTGPADPPADTPDAAACSGFVLGLGCPCTTHSDCESGFCEETDGTRKCADHCLDVSCDDGLACTSDACDPATGECTHVSDDEACNDNNACTRDECNVIKGCLHDPKFAIPCDDGDQCTLDDTCAAGTCLGDPIPGCCKTASDCDDLNPCTIESCTAETGECHHDALATEGSACDADGSGCTTGDACHLGVCVAGAVVACPGGGNVCLGEGICVSNGPDTHSCKGPVAPVGTPCMDGDPCTLKDKCDGKGKCVSGPLAPNCCKKDADCDDHDSCTQDTCNTAIGKCSFADRPDGALCDADGNGCTSDSRTPDVVIKSARFFSTIESDICQ
jgi:hypothetical protein